MCGFALWVALLCAGCGQSPEQLLLGRWTEVDWRYEQLDVAKHEAVRWIDGIAFPVRSEGYIARHEAEWWEFAKGGVLRIHKREGELVEAKWRLKGRGHVLRLESPETAQYELYDIKELSRRELILHYDIGMEVRGIARLRFERLPEAEARLVPLLSPSSPCRALFAPLHTPRRGVSEKPHAPTARSHKTS